MSSYPQMNQHKKKIRKQIIKKRKALTRQELLRLESAIYKTVINTHWFKNARRIALYLPHNGEAGTKLLIRKAWRLNKSVYLPVLFPSAAMPLRFIPYTPNTQLRTNCFNILEPYWHFQNLIKPMQLDLVITPVVAFTPTGARLGMGGGFYDRSFCFLQRRQIRQKPHLMGIAYEFQKLESLAVSAWDIPLQAIATENCLYQC